MRAAFESEGDLRGVDLLAALVALWRSGETGSLRAWRAGGSCGLDVLSGELVGVSTSDPRFETSAILVRAGKLEAAALERLSVPEGADRSLAGLQAGIITRREWRWGEKIRAIEVLADLLTWIEGQYSFDTASRPEAGELRLPVPRLILELFLRSRDRGLIEHQLGPSDVPLVRGESFDREFSTFGLTADAESVVALIDGRASAVDIARRAPAEDFAVQKLLAALITLGLVRPEYAPEEAARTVALPLPTGGGGGEEEVAERTLVLAEEEAGAASPAYDAQEAGGAAGAGRASAPTETPDFEWEADARRAPEEPVPGWEGSVDPMGDIEPEWDASRSTEAVETERAWEGPSELSRHGEPLDQSLEGAGQVDEGDGRRPSGSRWVWLLGLALLAIAAVFAIRACRGPSEVPAAAPLPVQPTAVAAPREEPTPAPAAAATVRPQETARPTAVATATQPARLPTAAPPAARPVGGRSTWDERARADARKLAGEPSTRYSIQLELACEVPTLAEAWKHDRPAGSMWLLPGEHRGRECFRVLWGRYPTLEAARSAKPRIPVFFVTETNRPAVVGVR